MSTALEIITQAFREGNFIAVGESPTTEEVTEALPRLRNLLASLFGFEIGEAYWDWYVPSDLVSAAPLRAPLSPTGDTSVSAADSWKYPPPNSRLLVKTTTAPTVYLPANPDDGARMQVINIGSSGALSMTLDGNGHLVEGSTVKTGTLTSLNGGKWFYRSDLGDWLSLTGIVDESSALPLPEEFDDYFVCGLAIRLSTRFQTKVDRATGGRFEDISQRLKKRYRQTSSMPVSYNELRSSAGMAQSGWDL